MCITSYSLWHGLLLRHELHPENSGTYYSITAVSLGSATRAEQIMCLLPRLLCQPGENKCVSSSYGSFQPLSLCLAYPGLSEQCEQQDNWHQEQEQPDRMAVV